MATLNIKDFPEALHERLKALATAERRSVAQQVVVIIERAITEEPPLSILELEGLGAAYWRDVGAVDHVRAERDSWD